MKFVKTQHILIASAAALVLVTGCRPNLCGTRFSERFLHRMDSKVEDFNLSPAQQKRWTQLRSRIQADLEQQRRERSEIITGLKREFQKENPDTARALTGVKDRLSTGPSFMTKHLNYLIEFYGILDDNQKRQFNEMFRGRLNRLRCEA